MNRRQGNRLRLPTAERLAATGGALVRALGAVARKLRLPVLGKRAGNRRRFGFLRKLAPTTPLAQVAPDGRVLAPTRPLAPLAPAGAQAARRPRGLSGRLAHLGTFLVWAAPLAVALLAFALPVIGVRAYEYVMQSGYFHVHEVLVDGNARIARDEVLTRAGIVPGTHLLDADLQAMEARLLADPWIRSARVERNLPDQLVVHLVEHRPTAFLAAGELYLVDENATPFMVAPVSEDLALPVVTGITPEALTDPKAATTVHHQLTGALNVARMWADQGLAARYPLGEIRVDGPRGYVVVVEAQNTQGVGTGRPIEVVLGRGPFTEKLYRLEWVLEHLHAQGKTPEYVLLDLFDGDAPASAEVLGGARVVVKAEVAAEEAAAALGGAVPALPAAIPDVPDPALAPRVPPGADDGDDPDAAPRELVPLSGGRPAAEPGLEE